MSKLERLQKEATRGSQQMHWQQNANQLSAYFFLVFLLSNTERKPQPITSKHQNKRSETSYNINGQTFKILTLVERVHEIFTKAEILTEYQLYCMYVSVFFILETVLRRRTTTLKEPAAPC